MKHKFTTIQKIIISRRQTAKLNSDASFLYTCFFFSRNEAHCSSSHTQCCSYSMHIPTLFVYYIQNFLYINSLGIFHIYSQSHLSAVPHRITLQVLYINICHQHTIHFTSYYILEEMMYHQLKVIQHTQFSIQKDEIRWVHI